ncbi:MAG: histidine phosphatase family protein [Deltaproteobacteria bacterium]|nr:histidine phosphatase family protein [Deltaproteobacteria bacterium]
MKILEVRRHSIVDHNGKLTKEGAALASFACQTLAAPVARAFSSPKPRAIETARVFGFTSPQVEEALTTLSSEGFSPYQERVEWFASKGLSLLESYFAVPEIMPLLVSHGKRALAALSRIANELTDGTSALAVSHGGTIEPAALLALGGEFELETMGGELNYCEGVRFGYIDSTIVLVETIRLPGSQRRKGASSTPIRDTVKVATP